MTRIKRGDIEILTMTIPERKKPCLFVATGNKMIKIGQFDNQETEKAFWTLIEYAFGKEDLDEALCREYEAKNCIKKLLSIAIEVEATGEERRTS